MDIDDGAEEDVEIASAAPDVAGVDDSDVSLSCLSVVCLIA